MAILLSNSFWLQLLVAFIISFLTVIVFNYYTLGKWRYTPILLKSWIKVGLLVGPFFLIINAIAQSGIYPDVQLGSEFVNFPNYLMFFATVLSVYLLYRTLSVQIRFNKISAFENRFFKFIDFHRENVNLLRYKNPKCEQGKEEYFEGNQVFTVIYYEIKELLSKIRDAEVFGRNQLQKEIDLAYQCVFYGAGDDGSRILLKRFQQVSFKKIKFFEKRAGYGGVYYSGHVRRLGHYFRNIYQAIKYVEQQSYLTEQEKYKYITHFRAQMSVYEQGVFFFNSLSELGLVWEYENYSRENPGQFQERKKVYKKLYITKYDLIRNTLNNDGEIIPGVSIKRFYPLITLERVEESTVSAIIPFKNNSDYICRYCFNEKYIEDISVSKRSNTRVHLSSLSEVQLNKFKCNEKNCESMAIKKELIEKSNWRKRMRKEVFYY